MKDPNNYGKKIPHEFWDYHFLKLFIGKLWGIYPTKGIYNYSKVDDLLVASETKEQCKISTLALLKFSLLYRCIRP